MNKRKRIVPLSLLATSLCLPGFMPVTVADEPAASVDAAVAEESDSDTALQFTMKSIDGETVDLEKYKGNVLVIVNTASKCGLTPQYQQLQELSTKYADQDVKVLGFPCNQFGGQEPGTEADIKSFCQKNYGVTFDMFAKVDVNGANACELYQFLTNQDLEPKGAGPVGWNFEKFIIDKSGKPVARFGSRVKPDDEALVSAIEAALAQ